MSTRSFSTLGSQKLKVMNKFDYKKLLYWTDIMNCLFGNKSKSTKFNGMKVKLPESYEIKKGGFDYGCIEDSVEFFKKQGIITPQHFIDSLEGWKLMRDLEYHFAQWTDEEFENYNKETGLIGVKSGFECYLMVSNYSEDIDFTR